MTAPSPPRADSQSWSERYERLRGQVLGAEGDAREPPWGLELLLEQGMAVWMQRAGARPPEVSPTETVRKGVDAALGCEPETTLLLANMTWSRLFPPPATPCNPNKE